MATNVTFKAHTQGPAGQTGEVSGTLSLNDVSVNTSPNANGGWNTATVTADKQQRIYVGATDAATAGIPQGWYENAGDHFRRQHRGPNFS
jgi:hypothetical protein